MPQKQQGSSHKLSVSMVRLFSSAVLSSLTLTKLGTRVNRQEHAYGDNAAERLDHLIPSGEARADAVAYFHGGGWVAGSKRFYTQDLGFLPDAGYAVFNVEYPLAPEFPHPHALHSMLRAVKWIKRNRPEVRSLHMMGDSAGGNMAAMYGVLYSNPHLLALIDPGTSLDDLLPPSSVVSLYGMLDRETSIGDNPEEAPGMVRLFLESYGGPAAMKLEKLPPEKAITPMDLEWTRHPRCFIGVGEKDFLLASSERYAKHLASLKIPIVEKRYPGAPHGFINLRHKQTPNLKQDVLDFISADVSPEQQ